MKTIRILLQVICVAALLLGGTRHATAQFGPNAFLESYSPTLIRAGQTTEVRVRIRTTIGSYPYRLRVTGVPSGWVVTPNLSNYTANLPNNRTHDFVLNVYPGEFNSEGNINIQLESLNDFGDEVVIFQQPIFITAQMIPQPFNISLPFAGAEVGDFLIVQWGTSIFADEYNVVIRRRVLGVPQEPPVFTGSVAAPNTFVETTTTGFVKGQQYQIDVRATNAVGERWNTNAPHTFTVRPADAVGSFSITSPSPNAQTSTAPTIQWSAASAVVSYTLSVQREINGLPQDPPLLVREGLTSTSFTWDSDPLSPGFYYVSVRAFGEDAGDSRFNDQGPVRFEAAQLTGSFSLLAPGNGQVNIAPHGIMDSQVEFVWEPLSGAQSYDFRLFEEKSDGTRILRTENIVPHVSGLPFISHILTTYNLIANRKYSFEVRAIAGGQQLASTPSRHEFFTSPMGVFHLVDPIYHKPDAPRRPTLTWNPTGGGGGNVVYFVQLAPMNNNGTPRIPDMISSSAISATSHVFNVDLNAGQKYVWRVFAEYTLTDPPQRRINQGSWQPFRVNPLRPFLLNGPNSGSTASTADPLFSWQVSLGAESYELHIVHETKLNDTDSVFTILPMIEVPAGVTSVRPSEYGLTLNSQSHYYWSVRARGGGATRDADNGPFTVTTGNRTFISACDLVDHLLGRQKFSERDRLLSGIGGSGFDIAYYLLYLGDPDQVPCVPAP